MKDIFDCILLLALPASGKSEIRKYIAGLPEDVCRKDFHLGPTVQLDDFPYVHIMRRIDDELALMNQERLFFHSPQKPFKDSRDWGTLIHLLNEDYEALVKRSAEKKGNAVESLLGRIESAGRKAGIGKRIENLTKGTKSKLIEKLEEEVSKTFSEKESERFESLEGKTLVVEFARGGPHGSSMPLPPPLGYGYSLSILHPELLKIASILYVWVTPEESRRKNEERGDPRDPGSILHHCVPIEVMMNDYGCDDMDYLERQSPEQGTILIEGHGRKWKIPMARFDNRVDRTSFVRKSKDLWKEDEIKNLHEGLKNSFQSLWEVRDKMV